MTMLSPAELIARIEAFLVRHDIPHTRFGREAIGEASFVKTMREGRKISLETAHRVVDFMARVDAEANHGDSDIAPLPVGSPGISTEISSPAGVA